MAGGEPSVRQAVSSDGTKLSRFTWATVFNVAIIATVSIALWKSRVFDYRTGLFPWVIGLTVLPLSIAQLVKDLMGKRSREGFNYLKEGGYDLPIDLVNRRTAGIFGWIISYCVAIWLFGFSIGLPLCNFLQLKLGGREKWPVSLILTGCTWAFIYFLFIRIMHIPFPEGKLWAVLKLG